MANLLTNPPSLMIFYIGFGFQTVSALRDMLNRRLLKEIDNPQAKSSSDYIISIPRNIM